MVVEILTIEAVMLVFKSNEIGFEDQCKYFREYVLQVLEYISSTSESA